VLKFIDVTTNFRLFTEKKLTKFACLQTLKVILAHAHGKQLWEGRGRERERAVSLI